MTSALAVLALTAPAYADVTADQVWQQFLNQAKSPNQTVIEGTKTVDGNVTTITGTEIKTEQHTDKSDTKVNTTIPKVVLTENGGTVEMRLPEPINMVSETTRTITIYDPSYTIEDDEHTHKDGDEAHHPDDKGDHKNTKPDTAAEGETPAPKTETTHSTTRMTLDMRSTVTTISGTPEAMAYDLNAPLVKINGESTDGHSDEAMTFTADITDTRSASAQEQSADLYSGKLNTTIGQVKAVISGKSPDTQDQKQAIQLDLGNLNINGVYDKLPIGFDPQNLGTALHNGLNIDANGTADHFKLHADLPNPDSPATSIVDSEGNGLFFGLKLSKENGISITMGDKGGKASMSGMPDDMPPMDYSNASSNLQFQMPLVKSDAAQPFALIYEVKDVVLGDNIWGLFDPKKVLPREPFNLSLDLGGNMMLNEDLTNEEVSTPPTVLDAVLKKFYFSGAGASIDATGAASAFDAQMTPAKAELNATMVGVNGLLDKAVTMGLVSAEDVQGYRLMMALFAKPVDGKEDTLQSHLEMKDGHAYANGVQVQ